mgnify:FL=1
MRVQKFTIYDEATGRITVSGTSFIPEAGMPLEPGQAILLGVATDNPGQSYICDGEIVAMPLRPSDSHEFDYSTRQWVPNAQMAWALARIERDRILRSSDWRVTKAAELGQPIDLAWAVYRQALRNITLQADPLNIIWPTVPA